MKLGVACIPMQHITPDFDSIEKSNPATDKRETGLQHLFLLIRSEKYALPVAQNFTKV